jgi:hypothetical protein
MLGVIVEVDEIGCLEAVCVNDTTNDATPAVADTEPEGTPVADTVAEGGTPVAVTTADGDGVRDPVVVTVCDGCGLLVALTVTDTVGCTNVATQRPKSTDPPSVCSVVMRTVLPTHESFIQVRDAPLRMLKSENVNIGWNSEITDAAASKLTFLLSTSRALDRVPQLMKIVPAAPVRLGNDVLPPPTASIFSFQSTS